MHYQQCDNNMYKHRLTTQSKDDNQSKGFTVMIISMISL